MERSNSRGFNTYIYIYQSRWRCWYCFHPVYVIMAKCGPGETYHGRSYHIGGFEYFAKYLHVLSVDRFSHRDSIKNVTGVYKAEDVL